MVDTSKQKHDIQKTKKLKMIAKQFMNETCEERKDVHLEFLVAVVRMV